MPKTKGPLRRPVKTTRIVIAVGGPRTDCFRSQLRRLGLGNRTGRDPGTAVRTYHVGRQSTFRTGTFYFGGNRNFLFWPDIKIYALTLWIQAIRIVVGEL